MFVLSIVVPPEAPAAFGKSHTMPPQPMTETFDQVSAFMAEHFRSSIPVNLPGSLAYLLVNTAVGTNVYDPATGATFRLDHARSAPHVCPCDNCGRLVFPSDHAFAHFEDALCKGCFTWQRGMTQCLPMNSGHTEEPPA